LIGQMAGTWDVQQRMWTGPGAAPIDLPPAIAHRRIIGGAFLEEVMDLAPETKANPFTRIAYFNYNRVSQQYEYCSIDTRAPQMMTERSYESNTDSRSGDHNPISLYGESFVAPQWGEAKNAPFRYRIVIAPVESGRQIVRLFLTGLTENGSSEFLAFEYVYTLRP